MKVFDGHSPHGRPDQSQLLRPLDPYVICGLGFYKTSYSYENASGRARIPYPAYFLACTWVSGPTSKSPRRIFFGAALTLHDVIGNDEQTPQGTLSTGGTFASFLLHAGYSF